MPDDQITSDFEPQKPRPPRVALIASRRTIDEYPLYLKFLLVGLADESIQVLLVCPPRLAVDSLIPPTVEVVRHPAVDILLMEHYSRKLLLDQLAEFKPDLIHCLCETKAALVRWLARHLDTSYLLNINSLVSRFHLLPLSPTRCAAIIAPAKTIADNFAAGHPKFAERIRQINIGAFVDDTTACFARPERVPSIIIAPPTDNPADIQNLLNALQRLTISGYQFMVAIIASGRTEKPIFKQLRALGLLRIVTVVPRLPELYSALSAADVFIVPRPSFSFNSLLLAAMSAGSVVAACAGGVDDLIIDGKTALVFNPDDQLSIYNCLKRIFDARETARQIASDAQQHLRQSHHVSDMVGSTLALYRHAGRPLQPQETH